MVLDNIDSIKMFSHCFTSTGYPTLASLVNFVPNYVTPAPEPGALLWSRLFSLHPRNFIIGTSYPTNLLASSQRILLKLKTSPASPPYGNIWNLKWCKNTKSHVNVMKIQARPHVSCHRYAWTRRVAGPCSATCGGGVRAVVWVCGDTRADTYHKVGTGSESCYNATAFSFSKGSFHVLVL